MIPTAILLGIIAGISRFRWMLVALIGVWWASSLGDTSGLSTVEKWLGGFTLGATNAAVGAIVGRTLRGLARLPEARSSKLV